MKKQKRIFIKPNTIKRFSKTVRDTYFGNKLIIISFKNILYMQYIFSVNGGNFVFEISIHYCLSISFINFNFKNIFYFVI